MKYIWEKTDIKPTDSAGVSLLGALVENTNTTASNRFSMLGYRYSGMLQLITLVSLDDGLEITCRPVDDMITFLNNKGYAPVMDPKRITNISADR